MKYYKNKKTGDIVEHDGMLFMSQPPQIKFIENGEVKMMQWPTFLEQYELLEENEMTLKLFDANFFWCKGHEEWLDEELDGLEMLEGEMYCAFCAKEIKKDKTE
jgi:hypothetical protein